MPVAELNGIELYYESHGEGPPIVFLHGAAGNHISWWQQVPHFRERYRCITIDHRGFGHSTDPAQEDAARFVDDLEALLERLGVERTALVAQSMGGSTAIGFAVRRPERVSALVMCDTWGLFDWPELRAEQELWREQNPGELLLRGGFGDKFGREHPDMVFLYQQVQALNPPREASTAPSETSKDDVAALTVPAMFIQGEVDPLAPPHIIKQVHELIPGSAYVEFPDRGHSVYWEEPQAFNRTLEAFLAKHPWATLSP